MAEQIGNEQVYMKNWHKLFIVCVVVFSCAGYAVYSRWLDSKELELTKVSAEKKLLEHERNYRFLLDNYIKMVAQKDKFTHPVVKRASKLENGDLLLIIGEQSNEKVVTRTPRLQTVFKQGKELFVEK